MHGYFESEKFRQELAEDEVGVLVLGEDCIEWLRSQLAGRDGIAGEVPILEDWGWTMGLSFEGARLWVNVQDWSFEKAHTWHLWLEPRGVMAWLARGRYRAASMRVRQMLDDVLSRDSAIRDVRWSETGPKS